MKLMIAVIRDIDDEPLTGKLTEGGYRVTRIASTGGFMRKGNITFLIGLPDEKIDAVVDIFQKTCAPAESGQKRATFFVVDAPFFEQI